MKKLILPILGLIAMFNLSVGICKAEGRQRQGHAVEEGEQATKELKIPKDANVIWKEINYRVAKLEEIIRKGELDKVHHVAFEISDLANALPKVSHDIIPDNKYKYLNGYVKRIRQHAKNLDKYGDAGNAGKTKVEFEQFVKRLEYLAKLYPVEIRDAGS
jgi:hypothetical protein